MPQNTLPASPVARATALAESIVTDESKILSSSSFTLELEELVSGQQRANDEYQDH